MEKLPCFAHQHAVLSAGLQRVQNVPFFESLDDRHSTNSLRTAACSTHGVACLRVLTPLSTKIPRKPNVIGYNNDYSTAVSGANTSSPGVRCDAPCNFGPARSCSPDANPDVKCYSINPYNFPPAPTPRQPLRNALSKIHPCSTKGKAIVPTRCSMLNKHVGRIQTTRAPANIQSLATQRDSFPLARFHFPPQSLFPRRPCC